MIEKNAVQIFNFIIKTLFYMTILLIIIYLYGYSGVGQGNFIYNEF
ncbi:teichoic acid D-Ala incorporation-associated protein DltX [Weissella coleopterorum]|uniref:Teichoic acid D-Ala incorporation-associated protein DltX n=1 Tax=Weissella coleopterorum TaxID=2714949 RepID=A0A6G8B219_9LACO|nr:teichoic acid D-Ala incorporation-associated protein DltX [Weissella coleopterorum]QIL51282.1 teichoic acid D-Ala incorporation-associated protein DltX [Weissella coleopterorum]